MSIEPRAYVTYFDQRYLGRALVMLRSLRRHDPKSDIYALCLDQTAYEFIDGQNDPKIICVSSQAMLDFDPSLAGCADRTRWAFYATHKPVLPLYVLSKRPNLAAVAYIDSDVFFYSSPEPLFAEIGHASIAVSPHRPAKNVEYVLTAGRFNAGFIYWRNDAVGLRCLADYREDCMRWCGEDVQPDGRFMNQGYLTNWPDRYPSVHVISHPGTNLASWNVANHRLAKADHLIVDGRPLIFFHFSNVLLDPSGIWRTIIHEFGDNLELILKSIYAPYLDEVERTESGIRRQVPDLAPIQRGWTPAHGFALRRGPWPRSWRGAYERARWLVALSKRGERKFI